MSIERIHPYDVYDLITQGHNWTVIGSIEEYVNYGAESYPVCRMIARCNGKHYIEDTRVPFTSTSFA